MPASPRRRHRAVRTDVIVAIVVLGIAAANIPLVRAVVVALLALSALFAVLAAVFFAVLAAVSVAVLAGPRFMGAVRSLSGRGPGRLRPAAESAVLLAGLPGGIAGWAMRLAARLMSPAVGRRWLAEADSFLFEASPAQRTTVVRDYLAAAPRVIAASWIWQAAGLARRGRRGRARSRARS